MKWTIRLVSEDGSVDATLRVDEESEVDAILEIAKSILLRETSPMVRVVE